MMQRYCSRLVEEILLRCKAVEEVSRGVEEDEPDQDQFWTQARLGHNFQERSH
jgi:hypothetical protein